MASSVGLLRRIRTSMARQPNGWRLYAVAIMAAALLAGIGMVTVLRSSHPALTTVDEYLSALQEGDSEKALEYVAHPLVGNHPFIADEAIDSGWTVNVISLNGKYSSSSPKVEVAVVLSTSDGATSTGVFEVSERLDWKILNPFVTLWANNAPVASFGVNDHTIPNPHPQQLIEYLAFPGVVRLSNVGSELVQRNASDLLVVSGTVDVTAESEAGRFELTDAGHERLQQTVDALFDDCAKNIEPLQPGCPFGATYVRSDEAGTVTDLEEAAWEVIEYPVVAAVDDGDAFVVATREPGLVELTTTGTDADRETVEVTVECATIETAFWFTVDIDDGIRLGHRDGDDSDWHTCRYRPENH